MLLLLFITGFMIVKVFFFYHLLLFVLSKLINSREENRADYLLAVFWGVDFMCWLSWLLLISVPRDFSL